jgi:hypothetical protein
VSRNERRWPVRARLLLVASRVAPRGPPPVVVDEVSWWVGHSSITARDQHQPASSRAMATLAITGLFLRSVKLTQRACSRRLPASPRIRAVGGASSQQSPQPARVGRASRPPRQAHPRQQGQHRPRSRHPDRCLSDRRQEVRRSPHLRVEGGLLRPRVEKLIVGTRDCTRVVDGVVKQIDIVSDLLCDSLPVHGVLCFVEADWPLIGGSFTTRAVEVLWPKKLYPKLEADGPIGIRY